MKIKYIISLLLISCFGIGQAQELEEIIQKHIEAHGGAEKWNAIENMKITAQFTAFSEVDNWMAIKTKNGKYYSELRLGKFEVIEAFDGEQGWTIDPWMDFSYPRLLNKTEENVFYQKSEWMTPFFNYKEKGLSLEYLGEEDLEGVPVYAIKITRPTEKFEIWYLSKDSYLEYKRVSMWVDFTYPAEAETYFEDFREVQGLIIPFYVEKTFSQRNRVLEIEKVELNIAIDEDLFKMPPNAEMEQLNFLVGNWNTKVEAWSGRANRWYPVDQTTSSIKKSGINLLEENIEYTMNFVMPIQMLFSFHEDSKTYRIARYNGFSSNLNMFCGNFNDTSFVVENTHIAYGDSTPSQTATRLIYQQIEADRFHLFIQNSSDEGESWMDQLKLTYSRMEE